MSIPLDRLYNFLHDTCNKDIIIYRWSPHGSRKLDDLVPIRPLSLVNPHLLVTTQPMICHDQEPLNYSYWSTQDFHNLIVKNFGESDSVANQFAPWHLRSALGRRHRAHVFGYTLLCHSEMHSAELTKYEDNNFLGVYYWSHALIARDWYRYAQFDRSLDNKQVNFDFLIYNRAWSGTREYRLKFTELLVAHNLHNHCMTKFSPYDTDDYRTHQFVNSKFQITNTNLETFFALNDTSPNSSGDYVPDDYRSTNFEIVLETIFDDTRWHLTEKILRPIACGQPFVLAATPGSLQYLKRYGFKTFDSVFDESYDSIKDPVKRLQAIINLMQHLQQHPQKSKMLALCRDIAQYNKSRFFSKEFYDQVITEFKQNFDSAYLQSIALCSLQRLDQCWTAIRQSGDYAKNLTQEHLDSVAYQRRYVENFVKSHSQQ
jgi:hypothetical protein